MKPRGFKCESCRAVRLHGFRIHRDAGGKTTRVCYCTACESTTTIRRCSFCGHKFETAEIRA